MPAEPYLTIAGDATGEVAAKRSRFVCDLGRADDADRARAFLDTVRRRHPDARHHCVASRIGFPQPAERSSDDGEPAGTAGAPMLHLLRRKGLTDVVAVVSRYFGGTLLGAGGLVRAYGGAVAGALEAAGMVRRERLRLLAVEADHARAGALEHGLRSAGRTLREVGYTADGVRIVIAVPDADLAALHAWLAEASAVATPIGTTYVDRRP